MPFYEYQCTACGAHHEELQRISDGPLRKCPACGRNTLRRLVSAPVFRLKGGGWYETDFKADKDNQRNLAGDKEPASATAATDKASDAKAEAKTEAKADAKADGKAEAKAEAKPAKPESPAAKPEAAKPKARSRARALRRSHARRGPRR